jgi:hypothetical protein
MRRTLVSTLGCALLIPGLVACGGSDQAAPESPSPTPSPTSTPYRAAGAPDLTEQENITGGSELLPRLSRDESWSAGDITKRITEYHDSGLWDRDIAGITTSAQRYVTKWMRTNGCTNAADLPKPCRVSATFDVDDTLLSSYPWYVQNNFVYGPGIEEYEQSCQQPTIAATQALFKYVQSLGIKTVVMTGRREEHREGTTKCLRQAGYDGSWEMRLRTPPDNELSAIALKTKIRKQLAAEGTPVLINVGDQISDLTGPGAKRAFLIPNPMYRLR